MRIRLLLALLLFPLCISAQERFSVKGRIVNEKGEAVEYVQVGIPKRGIGTISSVDGRFEINVPADTLEFHHVSYEIGFHPVSGPQEDVLIVLKESELSPAVFIDGDAKEKYLVRAGTRIPSATGGFHFEGGIVKGEEFGSVANARKPFLVKDILFSVMANDIPGCVLSINIYRIEGEPEQFSSVLHKPIYLNVAVSEEVQDFDVQPEESILLEPGRYYFSFDIVDCDMDVVNGYLEKAESERGSFRMSLYTFLYFKSSYMRAAALGEFKRFPVNFGIVVKGLEYQ